MKHLSITSNLFLFPFLFVLFTSFSFSAVIETDNFNSSIEGWTGDGVNRVSNKLRINKDKTATKTYIKAAYANQTVTFTLKAIEIDSWENDDDLEIRVDGTKVIDHTVTGTDTLTFTATFDNNGEIEIKIKPNTNSNAEKVYIDDITINTTPPPSVVGCNDFYDTPTNDDDPGVIITSMNGITTNTTECISGASQNGDDEYYNFTVGLAGILKITTTSPNNRSYKLKIGDTSDGNEHYGQTTNKVHTIPDITLAANETVYIYVKESGNNTDHYQLDFIFTIANIPPTANAGVNKVITLGNSVNITGSGSDSDGTVTGYVWKEGATTLSTNASFTYTPATGGAHTLTLTVTDNGGATTSDSMTVTVQAPPTANAGADQSITAGTVTFDGSGSSDSDGSIASYDWSYNATTIATGVSGIYDASAFAPGNYVVTLTVTDNDGFTDTDTVTIEIIPSNTPNISIDPVSTSIASGTASVTLDVNLNVAGNSGALAITYGGTCGVTGTVNIAKGSTSGSIPVNTSGFPVGSCTVVLSSATGSNGQLVGSISPSTSTITVTAAPISVDIPVSTGSDDAEEYTSGGNNGDMDTGSSDLEMVEEDDTQIIGIRFLVNLPAGTTITNAYIRFEADESDSGSTSLNIYAQDSGSTNTFTSANNNITNRPKTSTSVSWSPTTWSTSASNPHYNTPDLTSIINSVISRGDWANSSLTFIIDGSGKRVAISFDGEDDGNGDAAVLHLEYTSNPPPVADAGPDQYVAVGDNITFDGSGSTDDTNITSYVWSIGGTTIATGVNPIYIGGLSLGIHTVTLTVTDNAGGIGEDTVIIAVSGVGNDAPIITSNGGGPAVSITIAPSSTFITTVFAIDPDGDTPLTYSIFGGADAGLFTINSNNGNLSLLTVGTPGDSYEVTVMVTDPSGLTDTQIIFIIIDDPLVISNGDRAFTVRNPPATRNIRGNYAIIGNSNQCALDTTSTSNLSGNCYNSFSNDRPAKYIDIDSDSTTVNSTTSTLDIPASAKVIWAGLYWQGVIHNSTNGNDDFMGTAGQYDGDRISGEPEIGSTQIDLTNNSYGAEEVKLQFPGTSTYIDIIASQLDYNGLGYAGFKDITYLMNSANFNGDYTVADIKAHQGVEDNHGNYAAWSIVVIYEYSGDTSKNITLFDGYATVNSSFSEDLLIDGFLTPQLPPIESKIAFFAMDGDNGTTSLEIISENGVSTFATNQDTPGNNLFDATISSSILRDTSDTSLRTDLKVLDFTDVLGSSETQATLKPRSNGDRYTPSFFIMSADLRVPKLCYDYSVTTADGTVFTDEPTTNPDKATQFGHEVTSVNLNGEEHIVKVYIRSEEGDLQLENVTVGVTDFNATRIGFNRGEISHNGNFAYIPTSPTVTSPDPFLPFGNDDGSFNDGGTIAPNQSFYGKFYFATTGTGGDLDEYINITVKTHLNFGTGLTEFTSSTKDGNDPLERCERDPVYSPTIGQFNVERSDITHTNAMSEQIRYPLYTQIVGNPFTVSIVAQEISVAADTSPPVKLVNNIGVELELFKAGSFDNDKDSGFDILCEDYDKNNILENQFIVFGSIATTYVDSDVFTPTDALRNAAFRVWYIADENGSILFDQTCYDNNLSDSQRDTCFADKYVNDGVRAIIDPGNIFCKPQCIDSTAGCYECLKTTFGRPVCSRDNFAIRPAAIHIKLEAKDDDNPHVENNVSYSTPPKLAAGYPYPTTISAVDYDGSSIATKYYATFATVADPTINVNEAKFAFVDSHPSCADTSDLPISDDNILIRDGELNKDTNVTGKNVGAYSLSMKDNTWTLVDQSTYAYQTLFDGLKHTDCILDEATTVNAKFGCDVSSNVNNFKDLNVSFRPYRFDLSNIGFSVVPDNDNKLFMTDFSNAYYDTFKNDTMSVKISGGIIAKAYTNDLNLSNYTAGCVAENTILKLNIDSSLNIDKIEHALVYSNLSSINDPSAIKQSGDANMSLNKLAFFDAQTGIANIIIYSTFKKVTNVRQNPVTVSYNDIAMYGVNDILHTKDISDYLPEGNNTFTDSNVTFYYGKITPKELLYKTSSSNVDTPIYVDIYCDESNCSEYNLVTDSQGENHTTGVWYLADLFTDPTTLGTTNLGVSTISALAANPAVSPNLDIPFDDNTSKENINVFVTGDNRPSTVKIDFVPVPWLIDNPTSDFYRVRFLDNSAWSGVGNTGKVNESTSSSTSTNRMNW
jgi:hypothetical protein